MKKIISIILIFTMICLNVSTVIFAEGGNDDLNKFKEYNFNKISLYLSFVELYKSGVSLDIGVNNKETYRKNGGKIEYENEPEYKKTKNKTSWVAFYKDKKLTESQLYSLLGLEEESKSNRKSNNTSRTMFYGGAIALGIGFLMLCDYGKNSSTTEDEGSVMPGALLSTAGALAMVYGNKTISIKDIDYVEIFKLVKKHNVKLLRSYFSDVDVEKTVDQLENIHNLTQLSQYVHKDMGENNEEDDTKKDFNENLLKVGMTKKEVLANCGAPYFTDKYHELTSWEYVKYYDKKKLFNLGKFTGESYKYIIHTVYFENNILVDWTQQQYISE